MQIMMLMMKNADADAEHGRVDRFVSVGLGFENQSWERRSIHCMNGANMLPFAEKTGKEKPERKTTPSVKQRERGGGREEPGISHPITDLS